MRKSIVVILGIILLGSFKLSGEEMDLFSCIDSMLIHSEIVASAEADLNIYKQQNLANFAAFLPQILGYTSATYDVDGNEIGSAGLTISQKLSLLDDRFDNIAYYKTALERQKIQYEIEMRNEVLDVIDLYLNLLQMKKSLVYYNNSREQYQKELDYISQLMEIGSRTQLDRLSAQIEIKELELNINKLERDIRKNLMNLSNSIGKKIDNIDNLKTLSDMEFIDNTKTVNFLIENSSNWQTQEMSSQMGKIERRKNLFNLFPDLYLQGYYSWKQQEYWNDSNEIYDFEGNYISRDSNQEYWEVSLNLSLDFGNWLQNYSSYKIAALNYRKEQLDLQELRGSLNIDLTDKQYNLNYYREEVEINRDKLEYAENKFTLSQERYRQGLINFIDFKTAHNELLNSQIELSKSNNAYFYAQAVWQVATGCKIFGRY